MFPNSEIRVLPFEPASIYRVSSDSEVKAYLHPTRLKLLSLLTKKEMTISEVAREFKVHPANLTHHFNILEKTGLIRLVQEKSNGRNIEKFYRACALCFDVHPPKGEVQDANRTVLSFLREDLTIAIEQLKGDDSESAIGLLENIEISPEKFRKFAKKLKSLIKEYQKKDRVPGINYSLNLSLYPNTRDYGPTKNIHIQKKKRSINQ